MKKLLTLATLFFALSAHADEARNDAIAGAVADCASTIISVEGYNLIEANPLGKLVYAVPACLLKPVGIYLAEQQSEPARTQSLTVQSALWTGAFANNMTLVLAKVLYAAGVLSSPATGPVGPIVGVAVAGYVWNSTAPERRQAEARAEFDAICAFERKNNPNLRCEYKG